MKKYLLMQFLLLGFFIENLAVKLGVVKLFDMLDLGKTDLMSDGNNIGGNEQTIYIGISSDVATWATLPASPTDLDDVAVLENTFAFNVGKKFFTFYTTDESVELLNEEQGEVDGMSYKHIVNFFLPGAAKRLLGFLTKANNEQFVIIVKDTQGRYRVIGSEMFPARKQAGGGITSGKVTGDRKGSDLSFYSYGNTPAPIYEGTIPVTPATS